MSYVAVEMLQAMSTHYEARMGQLESNLNELFSRVDQKLQETSGAIQSTDLKVAQITSDMENPKAAIQDQAERIDTIKSVVPQRLNDILQETNDFAMNRTGALEQ